jgi:hypothetical protein
MSAPLTNRQAASQAVAARKRAERGESPKTPPPPNPPAPNGPPTSSSSSRLSRPRAWEALRSLTSSATPSAIDGACTRHHVSRNSQRSQEIREAIRRGVRLIREDVGGAIGVRWSSAHRGGETYPTAYCEALVEMGLLELDGSIYVGSGLYKPS